MIAGKLVRRGILKGALGLGAAIGVGLPKSDGAFPQPMPPAGGLWSSGSVGYGVPPREDPSWLVDLEKAAQCRHSELYGRPSFDGLDLDLAMLRSASPAWKMTRQRQRQAAREREMRSLWDHISDARKGLMKGILG